MAGNTSDCGGQNRLRHHRGGAGGFACQPLAALLLALLLPLAASAQSLRGTVTDAGHKALEGVAVRLVHQETNRQRNALTGGDTQVEIVRDRRTVAVRAGDVGELEVTFELP